MYVSRERPSFGASQASPRSAIRRMRQGLKEGREANDETLNPKP